MPDLSSGVSAELLAAQTRLIKLREQVEAERDGLEVPNRTVSNGRFPPPPHLPSPTWSDLADLPNHLGWESASFTAVLRSSPPQPVPDALWQPHNPELATETGAKAQPGPTAVIKLYPDIALAMLRQNQTAPGRIWLLLREMDKCGSGWIEEDAARQALSGEQSEGRVCGWRQLRNLLHQGNGLFWRRQNGRLWLASVAKVAAALGVARLRQRPVNLSVALLTQPISLVRAHFFASFHSSRQNQAKAEHSPIARTTLTRLAQISPHTQRSYEEKAGVRPQTHYAVGETITPEREEEAGWRRGGALFQLKDHRGTQGKPGVVYLAWQLPNSYRGPHHFAARGRQKRINRELIDLFNKGMTGNDQARIETGSWSGRRYVGNGRLADNALKKTNEVYWPDLTSKGSVPIWRVRTRDG